MIDMASAPNLELDFTLTANRNILRKLQDRVESGDVKWRVFTLA